jgi:TatD DNase family protein
MLIDSHAHLHDPKFNRDREEVIRNLKKDGIDIVINSGGGRDSNKAAVALAEKYDNIYATVGMNCGGEDEYKIIDEIRPLLKHKKVVAVGEIGLDYHHYPDEKEIQKKCFIKQIEIASEVDLPIVVHDRKANYDTFDIIKSSKEKFPNLRGVLHCYSGDLQLAREYVKLGFYLSIAGPVTYRSAETLKQVAKHIPLEYLFIETDSPYLPPSEIGKRRNEPLYVRYVAGTIAELKGISFEMVAKQTAINVRKLYNI